MGDGLDVDGTTEMFGVVHRVVRIMHRLTNVRTACRRYTALRDMHTRPKAVTCFECLVYKEN